MKIFLFFCVILVGIVVAAFAYGPVKRVDLSVLDARQEITQPLDQYLQEQEAQYSDIRDGQEKQIHWAGEVGQKTPIAIVYVHGFSASLEEIRPVPDKIAQFFEANLFFTRLAGHGRTGEAMAEATAEAWLRDFAQAVEIGRQIGERVVVMSTSTGGTLAAAAALNDTLMQDVAGLVFVSPNFEIKASVARLLTWPAAEIWLPWIAGKERSFETRSEDHATYWTSSYPSSAVFPMAALVRDVDALDLTQAQTPALFLYSDDDIVVSAAKTDEVVTEWGGPKQKKKIKVGPDDDPNSHVIAGRIMSPTSTPVVIDVIRDWILELEK